ncbi:DUF6270 domain-containing protein [Bacillus wiedmannii]|uniref:DUF6270 domain-containing protein n=1 Tax=Bacillus wiedmannii TaxID=1890302 RepID=UPI0030C9E8C3
MNISLLGSGLSQGLFHFQQNRGMYNIGLNQSFLKSSIISLTSEPIDIDCKKITNTSPLVKKSIEFEFSKGFFTEMEKKSIESDFFMLDFFEESFNLLKVENSYLTNTWALRDSGVLDSLSNYNEIDRFSEEIWGLWKERCLLFIERLQMFFKPNQILLHEAYLANKYIKSNSMEMFNNQQEIEKINNLLRKYYDFFKEHCPGIRVINFDDTEVYGDFHHPWGCKPYNLSDEYYSRLFDYINNTLCLKMEYYKIPFNLDWKFYREDISIHKKIDKLSLKVYQEMEENTIAVCSNYYDEVYGKQYKILPHLEVNAKYIVKIKGIIGNLDIRIGFNFYDKDGVVIYSKILTQEDNIIRIPSQYKNYRLYLRGKGIGNVELEHLEVRRYREKGVVTPDDQVFHYKDKVTYLLKEVKESNKLIVVFSCFNSEYNMTKYDFVESLRDINANVLFILDDYGINGTFYLSKNREEKLQQTIIKLIEKICIKKSISPKDIITLGESKGATAALYYGLKMNVGHIVAVAPSLYLGIYTKNNYIHQLSMCYRVAGGISVEDAEYLDRLLEEVLHKEIKSQISFLSINNDISYQEQFSRFCKKLNENNILYTNVFKRRSVHGDFPKYLDDWVKKVIQTILEPRKNIAIIGSCDSRDIFRVQEEYFNLTQYNITDYIARSSIVSMMSTPINLDVREINLKSRFRMNSLYNDITKKAFVNLGEKCKEIDYLVIDFMEERFDVLKIGDAYITNSWEFRESNLMEEWSYDLIKRDEVGLKEIWEDKCLLFIEELKKNFKPEQIILHEAYMVFQYKKNGDLYEFKDKENIEKMNSILIEYYSFFKENFSGIHVWSFNQNENYCDSNHLWGCQPYHFYDEYYLQANSFLESKLK